MDPKEEEKVLLLAEAIVSRLNEEQARELLIIQIATDLLEEDITDPKYQTLLKYTKMENKK